MKVIERGSNKSRSLKYEAMKIQLDNFDNDVDLVLPNGEVISLQFRCEAPTLDIVLPEDLAVTNWEGDDMSPALPFHPKNDTGAVINADDFNFNEDGHIRVAKQLCIGLNPEYLEKSCPQI
jgi:hypothetical protein